MTEFKHILFPVDFSAQSRAVAPFVRAMAKCFDAQVTALHVQTEAGSDLNRFLAEQLPGVRATAALAEGDPAQSIVKFAQDAPVDLIMMPTHGYGPFRALLLGSVTAKVLHDAHCPVWTGVHAEKMMAHSPDRWKRVLCALDTETDTGGQILHWASEFALARKMELRVVHAVAGADGNPGMYEFLFHAAREKLAALQTNIVLLPGSVGSAVHKAALDFDADLIVIGRHSRSLWSHAYSIIREAPCPVISRPQ